jgi:hypothetical protein
LFGRTKILRALKTMVLWGIINHKRKKLHNLHHSPKIRVSKDVCDEQKHVMYTILAGKT